MDAILRAIYYDVKSPAGFSSLKKLHDEASKYDSSITLQHVDDWLRGETTYTLHHAARRNFVRNPTLARGIGDWCQADLVDMQAYKNVNRGYRYILTFIDVFSKKAAAQPLKTKNMNDVSKALEVILSNFICCNLLTDRGNEFNNSAVRKVLKQFKVRLRLTYNDAIKASVAERFNRTLKSRMHRYFTDRGTRCYINVLQDLVDGYNRSVHRSIKMRPIDVSAQNSKTVFRNLYGVNSERELILKGSIEKPVFEIGDTVRMRYFLPPMEHSYFPTFTDETFKICSIMPDNPRIMYKIKDWRGDIMPQKILRR